MEKISYIVPRVHVVPLTVERGFAASLENPETDPEIDW